MDFARQQRDPTRHLVGITFVVLIHALVIYALVTGLARKAIEVIKKPLTATIIEEIKAPPPPPPPPPPKKIVELPKLPPPPEMPFVPPPDIPPPVQMEAPVISTVSPTPPVEPPVIAPPPPPAVVAKPAIRRGISPIERVKPVYPRDAIRAGVQEGTVIARLQIDEKGQVTDVRIIEANPPRVFDREVIRALSQWKFQADGDRYVGEIEVHFSLKDE